MDDIAHTRGICGAPETEMVYWMGFEDFIVDGVTLYADIDLTVIKTAGIYKSLGRNGTVNEFGVINGIGECA